MAHNGLQLLKDSFILKKRDWRGANRGGEGSGEKGAPWSLLTALPRWAQAWHQWPERAGILDMPTPSSPAIPLHPIPFEAPPTPSSFLGPASLDAALGQASWGHCHCLHVKQSACEARERKRRASHGTSQERGRLPRPSLHRPPLLAERCWCDPSTPFLPECPSHFPLCNPFLSAPLTLSVAPSFLRGPFERRWHVKGLRMSDFSWHNLCRQRWESYGFCCALGHLFEEEIAFQHISLIRIMW